MAIVMRMTWKGITPDQYDAVRRQADWVSNPAPGGNVHIASFADGALHCTDVWDSARELNEFLEQRIFPAVAAVGVTTQPEVVVDDCHELFVAHINTITLPASDRILAATPV